MAEIHGPSGRNPRWSAIRASDAERNQVVEELQQHYVDGRLTSDELTERIEQVWRSRTRGELQQVLSDLPAPAPAPVPRPPSPATAKGDRHDRSPGARIVLRVIAAILLLPIAFEIFEELTPVVLVAVITWLVVHRRSHNRSC